MTLHVIVGLVAVGACMSVETVISHRHEAALLRRGAVEPAGDVYSLMRVAYPASFLLMAAEAWWRGAPGFAWVVAGASVFAAAKMLKYAAIAALGDRWSFRVLVLPGAPLVRTGPYRRLDHPNYLAVVGELVGAACYFGAIITGPAALVTFGALILRRVSVERSALGRATREPPR